MQGYGIAGCQIASECQGHASIISIMIFELRRAWRATLERYFATLYWYLGKLQSFASLSGALPGREEEAAIAFARCARCGDGLVVGRIHLSSLQRDENSSDPNTAVSRQKPHLGVQVKSAQ